jgi:hypothetical protein
MPHFCLGVPSSLIKLSHLPSLPAILRRRVDDSTTRTRQPFVLSTLPTPLCQQKPLPKSALLVVFWMAEADLSTVYVQAPVFPL